MHDINILNTLVEKCMIYFGVKTKKMFVTFNSL